MKVTIIGIGNLGWHLANRLHEVGFVVVEVVSRSAEKGEKLSQILQSKYVTKIDYINNISDIYIIATPDEYIEQTAQQLSELIPASKLVVHVSGATFSHTALQPYFPNFGVLYPLQTFSIHKIPNFAEIPICIDANNEINLLQLEQIANKISGKFIHLNDNQRVIMHLAAVFVNNFTNHLFCIAKIILDKEQLSFDLLKPLIAETIEKIKNNTPEEMQTGPAKRHDYKTIERHENYINNNFIQFEAIYRLLTDSIQKTQTERAPKT